MTNAKTVTIQKIGYNDGVPSFGFGMTDQGYNVYLPRGLVTVMKWSEDDVGTAHRMLLSENRNDPNGAVPYVGKSMAIDKDEDAFPWVQDADRISALEDAVLFHKLRGLMPWGAGTLEAVRRAVAPYLEEPDELATVDDVVAEMLAMGFAGTSAVPAVSQLRRMGYLDGRPSLRPSELGLETSRGAVAAYDAQEANQLLVEAAQ